MVLGRQVDGAKGCRHCRPSAELPSQPPPPAHPPPRSCLWTTLLLPPLQALAKRLRQLESVAGRGLLLGCAGKAAPAAAAHYVTLSARCGGGSWRLVYRSEAVGVLPGMPAFPAFPATCAMQLPCEHAALPVQCAAASVQCSHEPPPISSLHLAPCLFCVGRGVQAGGTSNPEWQPLAWSELQLLQRDPLLNSGEVLVLLALHALEQQDGLGRQVLYAADSRPAFQLPEACSSSEAAAASPSPHNGRQPAAANGDQPVFGSDEQAAAASAKQQNGHHHPPAEQQQETQPQLQHEQQQQQHEQDEQQPAVQKEQQTQQHVVADWLGAAAAALASTGSCPGRLVAAWQLGSLAELFPAGADLAAVHGALQPNTLALQFSDGLHYLCPPPLRQEAAGPGSLQASPLKHGPAGQAAVAAGEERLDAAAGEAGPPGATRRFANLLVSKLLRSAPNLQVGGCACGGLGSLR